MPVRISKNRVALENIPLNLAQELDVASATTTNIGAALSNNLKITGTTTITAFDNVTPGIIRFLRFDGALTLTHNATSLILPGSANITTAAGDSALAVSLGSGNWKVHFYQKASGAAVVGGWTTASVRTLVIKPNSTTPNTKFDVSCDEAILLDSSNVPLRVVSLSITVDCTTTGAAGMDIGSLGVSTWYYVWAIAKTDGTSSAILSASLTAPTMPSGYTHKILLGVRRTTSGSVLEADEQFGNTLNKVLATEDVVFSGQAGTTSWTSSNLSSQVPPLNLSLYIRMGLNTTGTRSIGIRGASTYSNASDYGECASAAIDSNYTGRLFGPIHIGTTQRVYSIMQDTQAIYRMVIVGYVMHNVHAT